MKKITLIFSFIAIALSASAQNSFPAFYLAPKESYVKSMKQVFEDLRSRKWDKAQKDYSKMEEKSAAAEIKNPDYTNTQMEALYPLPQVAMSILLSTEPMAGEAATPATDYSKAYSLLKMALHFPDKDELNAFLRDPAVNVNINMLQDRIEKKLCEKATSENTEKAYDAVIDSLFPQSLRLQEMKMLREDLVFGIISKAPTEKECQRFLKKYDDAQVHHKNSITRYLDSLRYSKLDGSIASLEKYISKYPDSKYLKKAKDSLEILEYQNVKNTAASCRRFMEKYPSSRFVIEIKKRLNDLAYKEAIDEGTAEAYQRYCEELPYDLHYQEVFDSLLSRTVIRIYDTALKGDTPDIKEILSTPFYEAVAKREAAEQQLIERSLVPPRRRDLWTGVLRQVPALDLINGTDPQPFNCIEITGFNIMSKTAATVRALLTAPATESRNAVQVPVELIFIFEGKSLKLDDIRFDDGSFSQKNSLGG